MDRKFQLDWERMWHTEIKEEPRHLWPGQWLIVGWWEDEKRLYDTAESIWEAEQDVRGRKHRFKHQAKIYIEGMDAGNIDLDALANDGTLDMWDDYYHWLVTTPSWMLLRNGTWSKSAAPSRETAVYYSYEEAIKALAKNTEIPARYENYRQHLLEHINEHRDPYGLTDCVFKEQL